MSFDQESVDKRQTSRYLLLVLNVIVAEENQQCVLLHVDAVFEEFPANRRVEDRAYWVGHYYL